MKKPTLVYIFTFVVLCSALLAYGRFNTRHGEHFSWGSGEMKNIIVHIATGKPALVPFEFNVGGAASDMLFEIKEVPLSTKGISLEEKTVQVRNGKASSRLIFHLHEDYGTKAGHYAVTIVAKDAVSGKLVRTGEIPFVVDVLDLTWKCSC